MLHFGEMGSRWGIDRTVGQNYALLYVSARPQPADEITEALGFSRSNVSMGLKELQSWRLVRLQHRPADRREHFSTPDDIWQIVRVLAGQRRRREADPTLSLLRHLLIEAPQSEADRHGQLKLRGMHDLIDLLRRCSMEVQKLDNDALVRLLNLGGRAVSLLELKGHLPRLTLASRGDPPPRTDAPTASRQAGTR